MPSRLASDVRERLRRRESRRRRPRTPTGTGSASISPVGRVGRRRGPHRGTRIRETIERFDPCEHGVGEVVTTSAIAFLVEACGLGDLVDRLGGRDELLDSLDGERSLDLLPRHRRLDTYRLAAGKLLDPSLDLACPRLCAFG